MQQKTTVGKFLKSKKRMWVGLFGSLALVLFLVSGALWWTKIYQNPTRSFWSMINNNLATRSVTKSTGGDTNGSTQYVRLNFGANHAVETRTTISQNTEAGDSKVVTETLSTPTDAFVRYALIHTTQKNQAGQPFDFSKVQGVWAKQDGPTDGSTVKGNYVQSLLTLVPFGDLNPADRNSIVSQLKTKNAYTFNANKVTSKSENGRTVLSYQVDVNTKAYATVLQNYLQLIGLGKYPDLDPSNYQDTDKLQAEFTIDKLTHTLVSINYINSGQTENYSDFGVNSNAGLPANSISLADLQARLQAIQ